MRRALFVLLLAIPSLALLPQLLSPDARMTMFAEDGVLEWLAAASWLLAALVAVARSWPVSRLMLCYAAIFCLLAAREADLLGGLVSGGGKQAGRAAYYLGATGAPLGERILIVLLLAATLLALGFGIWGTLRNLRRPGELSRATLHVLLLAGGVLVFSQACEKLLDLSYGLGGEAGKAVASSFWALEEGLEALAPLMMVAALMPRRWKLRRRER